MRRKYQRRTAVRHSTSGHFLFGGTGWLFADLLLALALAFLLATTVGSAPKPPPLHRPTPSPSPSPSGSHPKQPPPLELDPVSITFTIADPAGLVTGSSTAVAAVRSTILQKIGGIKGRSAGIVLLYGSDQSSNYEAVDEAVENILKGLSGVGPLFHQQTRYRSFLNLRSPDQFSMDVYLFGTTG